MHHVAEIAGGCDVREGRANALGEFGRRQAAAYGQPQIRGNFRHGVEYWRRDGEVTETVAGDVDEEMQLSDS